ncbi:MAG: transglycosylase domain-containing protein, partial [Polyangiales bacterium]
MTDSHPHPPRTAVDPSGRDAEGGAVDTGDGSGDPLPLLRTKTPTPHVAPSAPQSGKSPTERSYRILRRLAFAGASGVLCAVLGLAALFWYYGRDLPAVSTLAEYRPPQTTRVYDRHGQVMGEIFLERRTVVPMRRIAKAIVACVLAAEDADFFSHRGLDYPGIVRALVRDLVAGRPAQGASTITQQVVKLMLLNSERTIARKVRELILARRLEQQLSKRQILHLYLNHINFGHGRYGVQEAARFYFGKDAADLSLAEASRIAGIPQAPARLSPRSHPAANRRRQLYVLRQLEDKRDKLWPGLQVADIKAARQAELQLAPASATEHSATNAMAVVRRRVQRWL